MNVPNEVPVGQLGVLGRIGLDVPQSPRHFSAGICHQLADYLSDEESIVEVGSGCWREGDVALLVFLPCVERVVPALPMMSADTNHS